MAGGVQRVVLKLKTNKKQIMENSTGGSKFWVWVLVIYAVIALYIMYTRSQQCKLFGLIGATNRPTCADPWQDIILPGLTLGIYKKPVTLADLNQCGPPPSIQPGSIATCTASNGVWGWVVTSKKKEGDACIDTLGNPSTLGANLKCIEVSGGGNGSEVIRGANASCYKRYTILWGGTKGTYVCPGIWINGICTAPFSLATCKKV